LAKVGLSAIQQKYIFDEKITPRTGFDFSISSFTSTELFGRQVEKIIQIGITYLPVDIKTKDEINEIESEIAFNSINATYKLAPRFSEETAIATGLGYAYIYYGKRNNNSDDFQNYNALEIQLGLIYYGSRKTRGILYLDYIYSISSKQNLSQLRIGFGFKFRNK
jgi:hypothetical protein